MKIRERIEVSIYTVALAFCIVWLVAAAIFYLPRPSPEDDEKTIKPTPGMRCEFQLPCTVTLENGATVVMP